MPANMRKYAVFTVNVFCINCNRLLNKSVKLAVKTSENLRISSIYTVKNFGYNYYSEQMIVMYECMNFSIAEDFYAV